jgi:hypothetical protein
MDFKNEIWKVIDGFPDYMISSFGRVISNKSGESKVMSIRYHNRGYVHYIIRNENGGKSFKAHRLVACAFIDNVENKPQVNHINGIKDDNRVENLEWCTNQENNTHSWDIGRKAAYYGQRHHKTKLSEIDVIFIRQSQIPSRKLGKMFGVDKSSILHVKKGLTHKSVV